MKSGQTRLFANRSAAGEFLAEKVENQPIRGERLILALPRGGVPVAFPIAEKLGAPMDVFIVRKLGVPGYEELAMGAIASGGVRVLNEEVIQRLGVSEQMIDAVAREELAELQRREAIYRDGREPPEVLGKDVFLVDDGLATGASMRAAVRALRKLCPGFITVAVPVASADTCEQFRSEVDEIICGKTPEPFMAVGKWYEDFAQTSDEEVRELLHHAAHLRRVRKVRHEMPEVAQQRD